MVWGKLSGVGLICTIHPGCIRLNHAIGYWGTYAVREVATDPDVSSGHVLGGIEIHELQNHPLAPRRDKIGS